VSADSVNQCNQHIQNIQNNQYKSQKLLPALIKQSRCKTFNKYKACVLVSGTVLMSCYTVTNNFNYEIIGVLLTSGYFSINLGFSYVENYLNQLDEWRFQEAQYEEKTDPPEWNWKIVNYTNHISIIFNLLACITELDDHYFYLGNGLQVLSICMRLNNNNNTKNLVVCFMDFISMVLFILNKINILTSIPNTSLIFILPGTYLSIVSELISI